MAVDVEPCVFWRGDLDDSCPGAPAGVEARVERWAADIGFHTGDGPGGNGLIAASPLNGPSGIELDGYFDGLEIPRCETVLADVYPVFLVHRSSTSGGPIPVKGRKQGDAIAAAYDPVASRLVDVHGTPFSPASLPPRPTGRWHLPEMVSERFGTWITDLLLAPDWELVVTLGQEPWDTLVRLGAELSHPAASVGDLRLGGYGQLGQIRIGQVTRSWLPMPHPGLLMKARAPQSGRSWREVHDAWVRERQPTNGHTN